MSPEVVFMVITYLVFSLKTCMHFVWYEINSFEMKQVKVWCEVTSLSFLLSKGLSTFFFVSSI